MLMIKALFQLYSIIYFTVYFEYMDCVAHKTDCTKTDELAFVR